MAFNGKTAVITGGTGGIGFECARHLLEQGVANMALLDIVDDKQRIEPLKRDFRDANIILLKTDISKKDVIEHTFKEVFDRFRRIDIVINSAGILRESDIESTVNTNLMGVINTTLVAMKYMSKDTVGHGGIIVNVSSVLGLTTIPSVPTYVATKHAVLGFTRSLAHDCYYKKHGIKFLIICPGLTETRLVVNFSDKILFAEAHEYTNGLLSQLPVQSSAIVGKCITMILPAARNGSIWIIDDGKIEEVSITKYWRI